MILNWNNKPARGYAGADDEWTWGSVQRVDLLWDGIARRQKHTLATVVGAMNGAATQDLRLMRVWPIVRDVLARGAGTPRAAGAAAQVDAWLAAGGSRLDADLDGKIDAAGAAVLDVAWPKLANAVLAPVLDAELRQELARLVPNDPALQTDGSSAYSGWWSYVHKDLRTLLARPVAGTYATHFCGGGDVGALRGVALGGDRRGGGRALGRHRAPTRPRGGPTRRRSGSSSHPEFSPAPCAARTSRRSSRPSRSRPIADGRLEAGTKPSHSCCTTAGSVTSGTRECPWGWLCVGVGGSGCTLTAWPLARSSS